MTREKEQLKGAGLKSASELSYITPEGVPKHIMGVSSKSAGVPTNLTHCKDLTKSTFIIKLFNKIITTKIKLRNFRTN